MSRLATHPKTLRFEHHFMLRSTTASYYHRHQHTASIFRSLYPVGQRVRRRVQYGCSTLFAAVGTAQRWHGMTSIFKRLQARTCLHLPVSDLRCIMLWRRDMLSSMQRLREIPEQVCLPSRAVYIAH